MKKWIILGLVLFFIIILSLVFFNKTESTYSNIGKNPMEILDFAARDNNFLSVTVNGTINPSSSTGYGFLGPPKAGEHLEIGAGHFSGYLIFAKDSKWSIFDAVIYSVNESTYCTKIKEILGTVDTFDNILSVKTDITLSTAWIDKAISFNVINNDTCHSDEIQISLIDLIKKKK